MPTTDIRSAEQSPDPTARQGDPPTFVLVHGAHGNSWSWSPLLRELALIGHRGLAVDLPGHGIDAYFPLSYQAPQDLDTFTAQTSPPASITLADNVAHVIATVRRVAEFGPVILVETSGVAVLDLPARPAFLVTILSPKLASAIRDASPKPRWG